MVASPPRRPLPPQGPPLPPSFLPLPRSDTAPPTTPPKKKRSNRKSCSEVRRGRGGGYRHVLTSLCKYLNLAIFFEVFRFCRRKHLKQTLELAFLLEFRQWAQSHLRSVPVSLLTLNSLPWHYFFPKPFYARFSCLISGLRKPSTLPRICCVPPHLRSSLPLPSPFPPSSARGPRRWKAPFPFCWCSCFAPYLLLPCTLQGEGGLSLIKLFPLSAAGNTP